MTAALYCILNAKRGVHLMVNQHSGLYWSDFVLKQQNNALYRSCVSLHSVFHPHPHSVSSG